MSSENKQSRPISRPRKKKPLKVNSTCPVKPSRRPSLDVLNEDEEKIVFIDCGGNHDGTEPEQMKATSIESNSSATKLKEKTACKSMLKSCSDSYVSRSGARSSLKSQGSLHNSLTSASEQQRSFKRREKKNNNAISRMSQDDKKLLFTVEASGATSSIKPSNENEKKSNTTKLKVASCNGNTTENSYQLVKTPQKASINSGGNGKKTLSSKKKKKRRSIPLSELEFDSDAEHDSNDCPRKSDCTFVHNIDRENRDDLESKNHSGVDSLVKLIKTGYRTKKEQSGYGYFVNRKETDSMIMEGSFSQDKFAHNGQAQDNSNCLVTDTWKLEMIIKKESEKRKLKHRAETFGPLEEHITLPLKHLSGLNSERNKEKQPSGPKIDLFGHLLTSRTESTDDGELEDNIKTGKHFGELTPLCASHTFRKIS